MAEEKDKKDNKEEENKAPASDKTKKEAEGEAGAAKKETKLPDGKKEEKSDKTEEKKTADKTEGEKNSTEVKAEEKPNPETESGEKTDKDSPSADKIEKKSEEKEPEKTGEGVEEKPKKKFGLPFGNKGADVKQEKKMSALDTINQLDEDIKLINQSKETELAEQIDDQIQESSEADYLTIKVKKQKLLLVLGVLVIVMWIIPIVKLASNLISGSKSEGDLNKNNETVMVEEGTQADKMSEASQSATVKIRIKDSSHVEGAADKVAEILKAENFDFVEVVSDDEVDYESISVISKPGKEEIGKEVKDLLKEKYTLSETNSVLSPDSDFDVVVLFGKAE